MLAILPARSQIKLILSQFQPAVRRLVEVAVVVVLAHVPVRAVHVPVRVAEDNLQISRRLCNHL